MTLDHDPVRIVCVEGDSKDRTYDYLRHWQTLSARVQVVKCDTGKPKYGSEVNAERFALLAQVFNTALDTVDLRWSDYVLFLPSDIVYRGDLLRRLLAHGKDIIAPFSWSQGRFYDTWGFTRAGKEFVWFKPDYAKRHFGDHPIDMDTVGGTVLIKVDVLRTGCRYTPKEVDRGLCRLARATGFSIWADPTTHVFHPPYKQEHVNELWQL